MKSLIVSMLVLLSTAAKADTIVGLVIGMGTTGKADTVQSAASNTQTSSNSPHNGNGNGSGNNPTTTTVNNSYESSQSLQSPGQVVGLLVLTQIEKSPLYVGAILQTNQTYSYVMSIRF